MEKNLQLLGLILHPRNLPFLLLAQLAFVWQSCVHVPPVVGENLDLSFCEQALANLPEDRRQCLEDWLLEHPRMIASDQIRYTLANEWLAAGNPGRAVELAEDILASDPGNRLADILLQRGRELHAVVQTAGAATNTAAIDEADSRDASTEPVENITLFNEPQLHLLVSRKSTLVVRIFRGPVQVNTGSANSMREKGVVSLHPGDSLTCFESCFWGSGDDSYHHSLYWSARRRVWYITLPIETYLQGVVGSEMASGWPQEALRAQAVVSRTYAWAYYAGVSDPVILEPTTWHQVYRGGISAPDVVEAVQATVGQVLTHSGQPIVAYFHADNGGFSEQPEYVWGDSLPYFAMVTDPWSDVVPHWEWSISKAEFMQKLVRKALPKGWKINRVRLLRHHGRRIHQIRLETDKGELSVSGNDFRLLMGPTRLRSLWFKLFSEGDMYRFSGYGYGHGVGLSQWGARRRADAGQLYPEILASYYVDTRLERHW